MKNKSVAVIFILIGIGGLFSNYLDLSQKIIGNAWVLVFWVLGFAFEIGFFNNPGNRNVGLLVPGGIFLTLGFIFSFCAVFGYGWMGTLWPLFILAPAVGLFQLYLFGEKSKGLLIPVGILGSISGIFLVMNLGDLLFLNISFPAILIGVGVLLIFTSKKKEEKE